MADLFGEHYAFQMQNVKQKIGGTWFQTGVIEGRYAILVLSPSIHKFYHELIYSGLSAACDELSRAE